MEQSNQKDLDQEAVLRKAVSADASDLRTIIVCFFTGHHFPEYAACMPRHPAPPPITRFGEDFLDVYREALSLNPAIHDGAVLVGRQRPQDPYEIVGWSYRLFPPPIDSSEITNKGAAFNSSIAMSLVERVDRVYLLSHGEVIQFREGTIFQE